MQRKNEKKQKPTLKELKEKLKEGERAKNEYLANWQRERADFINYKRDEGERLKDYLEGWLKEIVLKILPILDNFELAEKNLSDELKNEANVKGLIQIKKQLEDFLRDQGLEEIEVLGQKFDPNTSEAVEEIKTKEGSPEIKSNLVLEEIQKGYAFKGKIIRPAKVKISK